MTADSAANPAPAGSKPSEVSASAPRSPRLRGELVASLALTLSIALVGCAPRQLPDPIPDTIPTATQDDARDGRAEPASAGAVEETTGRSAEGVAVQPTEEMPRPLPEVRVEQVAGGEPIHPDRTGAAVTAHEAELAALQRGELVTLTAANTDVRALLAALAEAAGVNLVVSPEVEGRISVHLEDVPAREALETVIRESGNMVARPFRAPWGSVVFYVEAANVDGMTPAEIQARFGVSEELARFMVRARIPQPR